MVVSFAACREGLHREGDRTTRRCTGSLRRKFLGTRIRHARRVAEGVRPGDVGSLAVTMIQSALGTALVSGVRCPPCAQTSLLLAQRTAVGLATEILDAHEEPAPTDSAEKLVQID
jgi:hypothetical protein